MKGKTLVVLAMAAVAFTTAAAETDRTETKNREFLVGYSNADIKGAPARFDGLNVEYRQFFDEHFGVGGSIGYGYDSKNGADLEIGNVDVNALAKMQFDAFYVYGKLGASYTTAKATGTACNFVGCFEVSADDSNLDPFAGVGINVPFNKNMSFDLSYSIKKPDFWLAENVGGETDIRTIMAQVGWRF